MQVTTKIGVAVVVVLSSSYIYAALRGPQGFAALQHKWQEVRELQFENAKLAAEVQARSERIHRLQQSTSEQELEIRKRLKKLRKGETSFIHPDDTDEEPAASPAPETQK